VAKEFSSTVESIQSIYFYFHSFCDSNRQQHSTNSKESQVVDVYYFEFCPESPTLKMNKHQQHYPSQRPSRQGCQRHTLLSELERVSSTFPESPCCNILSDPNDMQLQRSSSKILTHQSFWKCLCLHQVWLDNALENIVSRMTTISSDVDIAIAYLSSNSIDMLASVLASTVSLNSTTKTTRKTSTALLNTRWTPTEMIAALQPRSDTTTSVTILLHDSNFQFTAQKVAADIRAMSRDSIQYQAICMPIPALSQSFLQSIQDPFSVVTTGFLPPLPHRQTTILDNASRDDALVLFTSGTSGGGPKGVRLSHRALLIQALAKLEPTTCAYSPQTQMLASTVPLFHVGGLNSLLACLLAGGCLVFPATVPSSSSFRVQDIFSSLCTRFTTNTLVVVPAMLSALYTWMDHHKSHHRDCHIFPDVCTILIGGQSASAALLQRTRATFPKAKIVQTYACTEAASSLTFWNVTTKLSEEDMQNSNNLVATSGDCVGYPPKHVELQLRVFKENSDNCNGSRPSNNSAAAISTPYTLGVIASRGPHLMNGYWTQRGTGICNNDGLRHDDDDDDHWFVGGDLGYFDKNGRLYFGGRVQDSIRTGGETVLAVEVERVMEKHPDVLDCAAFPLSHDKFGEAVACAVVLKSENNATDLSTWKSWCKRHGLAGFKHPKVVFAVDSLPRNSSGKILKHQLVAKFGTPTLLHSKL
jgi:acyl-CoA synthetase (AMP-forming)/AMP-acid ligase II